MYPNMKYLAVGVFNRQKLFLVLTTKYLYALRKTSIKDWEINITEFELSILKKIEISVYLFDLIKVLQLLDFGFIKT